MLACLCSLLPTRCSSLPSACSCCQGSPRTLYVFLREILVAPDLTLVSPAALCSPQRAHHLPPVPVSLATSMDLPKFLHALLMELWGGAHLQWGCHGPHSLSHCVLLSSPCPPPPPPPQSVLAQAAHASGPPGGWWEARWPLALRTHDALCRAMLRHPESFLLPDGLGSGEVMKVTYPAGKGRPGQGEVSSWGR